MGGGMSRSWEIVLDELLAYLPPGFVWPRGRDSMVAALLEPLARGIANLEGEADERRRTEINPATAIQCLEDYERILGPDPCRPDGFADTLEERQSLAHARWTEKGGASVPYFVDLAARRGVTIHIEEFSPARCGVTECGEYPWPQDYWQYPDGAALATEDGAVLVTENDEIIMTGPMIMRPQRWRLGSPSDHNYWRVTFGPKVVTWARAGSAVCGITPMADFPREPEVECAIERRRPAQTEPIFDYSAWSWQPPDPQRGLSS
jgi:uncharacterized protein YmfQ (DUF2313 family)